MTKCLALCPPLCRPARLHFESDPGTSQAAPLYRATTGTLAGGWQTVCPFCRRLTFAPNLRPTRQSVAENSAFGKPACAHFSKCLALQPQHCSTGLREIAQNRLAIQNRLHLTASAFTSAFNAPLLSPSFAQRWRQRHGVFPQKHSWRRYLAFKPPTLPHGVAVSAERWVRLNDSSLKDLRVLKAAIRRTEKKLRKRISQCSPY